MPQRKEALKRLSYGVYVVTTRHGEEVAAMTARMVAQVSVRPPCIGLSVAKRRYTHGVLSGGGVFVVNVLAEGQAMLGGHFGLRSSRDFNKLAGVNFHNGELGVPVLNGVSAYLECRVIGAHEVGNCTLFMGEVLHSGVAEHEPLVYRESDYFC